ncbi:MotB-like transcriptional regulator [Klebsiella phage Marfa]|uniref:Transcription regulatory protein n=1 Tax=Klebsiella phage Marfa TaxID=2587809 RepID=A0A4Y5TRL2_9CAUD|nr:MotB-like transcriptional regulator [Klebsiella phage Marfa]QDB71663.1 transcription regulatory protein [Klebsiella phage Marfa]
MIPIDSLVYVSTQSRSRIAGKSGIVDAVRFGWLGEIKEYVISSNGVVGYVSPEYVSVIGTVALDDDDYDIRDDLLCKAVQIETPFIRVCGWVSDQWVEDGVELLNVVHDGDYSVVPRSAVKNIIK